MLLRDRWDSSQYRLDARSALVACSVYNVNRGKNRKALKVSDLIGPAPGEKDRKKNAVSHGGGKMSNQAMLNKVLMLNDFFGGADKRKKT